TWCQGGGGLSADHADLQRDCQRGRRAATHRLHQIVGHKRRGESSMTNAAATPTLPREHYLNASYGIKSWLLTTDHKRIALLYLVSITLFFFVGGIYAALIRLELLTPYGHFVSDESYNKLFTMHGLIMI